MGAQCPSAVRIGTGHAEVHPPGVPARQCLDIHQFIAMRSVHKISKPPLTASIDRWAMTVVNLAHCRELSFTLLKQSQNGGSVGSFGAINLLRQALFLTTVLLSWRKIPNYTIVNRNGKRKEAGTWATLCLPSSNYLHVITRSARHGPPYINVEHVAEVMQLCQAIRI